MAAHYDRVAGQYATRPSPIAGPSRGDPFYERDRRIPYPARREPEYIEDERLSMRRDDRPHYPPQDYGSPARESRAEMGRSISWSRHPSSTYPHSEPPPVSNQYPRYYQDTRPPPVPQWEGRVGWGDAPDARDFEPGPVWRNPRREPPVAPPVTQNSSWTTTTPPSPRQGDYRRRETFPVPVEPSHSREYGRSYSQEHHQYDHRRTAYYERPSIPDSHVLMPNDAHRQVHVERPPPNDWENHAYRPEILPAPRYDRPGAMREYKRSRQESVGQLRYSDNDAPVWMQDRGAEPSRHSRQSSLHSSPITAPGYRERTITGSSQGGPRHTATVSPPPITKAYRNAWEGSSDELEFSGDDLARGLKQTLGDISRSREAFGVNEARKESQFRGPLDYRTSSTSTSINLEARPHPVQRAPHPVVRRAWDPSTDQFVPIVDDNAPPPWRGERRAGVSPVPANTFNQSHIPNQASYGRSPQLLHASPIDRAHELYSNEESVVAPSTAAAQGNGSGRQGVMSVHNLVSPNPVKPQTSLAVSQRTPPPLTLDDDIMQIDPVLTKESGFRRHVGAEVPAPVTARLTRPEGWFSEGTVRTNLLSMHDEPIPGLERRRSPSDEPDAVENSRIPTPELYTPEPDADVEVQIMEVIPASPKASVILQPGEKISEDGTMRILAPRPKANKKDITEMLRKAIVLRRTYDAQSRDQRVNPILMDNLAKSDGPEQNIPSATGNLIEEVVERILAQAEEEKQMDVRAILATKFAGERESLAEKRQRLRDEYLTLHNRWVARCNQLDSLFKANEMQESLLQAGRSTRRSAATLGDAVRSDLEMEQIIATLGNEDLTDPNHLAVRNVATIPDMLSVVRGKVDCIFDDTNNEVDDPANLYDPRSGFYDWTPEEEAIFHKKYAEYPKQFGIISQFLEHKTSRQCVLYYYIHKKRLVDFRNAVNAGNGKRRKGVRKGGKQKGNALLADVAQADSRRPAGRGRRGRGGFANGGRGRGGAPPPSTEENGDADARAKRRRGGNTPRPNDTEDVVSVDTDNTREASVLHPKKRRGRKPKSALAAESPDESPAPGEVRAAGTAEGGEAPARRRPGSTATYWSESDREIFMRSLARYGKDFKRIAVELPSKTHAQVQNYYKNHNKELGLEKIALAAANRPRTPDQDRFVTVTREEASQSRTPMEEISADQALDRQVADATSGVGVLTLEQNGKSGQTVLRANSGPRGVTNKSVIKVLNPDNFQIASDCRPQGVLMTPSGQSSYSLSVAQQPAQPQASSSMTSTMNFQGVQRGSGTGSPTRSNTQDTQETRPQVQDRPRSQPSGAGVHYTFHTHTPPIPNPPNRMVPVHFIPPPNMGGGPSPPPRSGSSPHGLVDFRSGIPVHLLPATHPGFWPPSQTQGSPPQPSKATRQE